MYASAQTKLTPVRRLLSVVPVLALAVILATGFVSPHRAVSPRPVPVAVTAADGLSSHDGAEAIATTPRELIPMEAAGLVTLARPMPAPQLRPAWQGGAGYHVWGDCTDPFARQVAPVAPMEQPPNDMVSDSQWQQACLEVEGWRGNPPLLAECVQRGLSVDPSPR